ncbi:MAG: hypothetical protein ACKVHU_19935 [Acidimicrobiales bacterium]
MQLKDRWNLDTTVSDQDSLTRYEHLLDGYVTFASDLAPGRLQAALAEDPAPMAQVLYGHFMTSAHTAEANGAAQATLSALKVRLPDLNPREKAHVAALDAAVQGHVEVTNDIWCDIVSAWPTDMAALRLSHFGLFNRGDLGRMESVARVAANAWSDDLPRRSYLGGMQAFALEELGRYEEAEAHGRAAVDVDEHDLWSIHAVAHTLEMRQRVDDGLEWFAGRGDVLDSHGSFAGHLWWHHALYLIEAGQFDEALTLHDRSVFPEPSIEGLTLTNSIALLSRLEFAGADIGTRWHALLEPMRFRIGVHSHPFNDCHFVLGACLADDVDLAVLLVDGMTEWATTAPGSATQVLNDGGLNTARGLLAFGQGNTQEAERLLAAGLSDRWRLGGSHAQRDVFEQARIASAERGGDTALAHRLLEARIAKKPGSPATQRWLSRV